jgi:catechol 2,3-dioxygenase-like lactoylglutathione lyase family enzyme
MFLAHPGRLLALFLGVLVPLWVFGTLATGVRGLRLVKLTVNFDDPGAYHLYYGDEVGHPGTLLTLPPRRGHSSRAPSWSPSSGASGWPGSSAPG